MRSLIVIAVLLMALVAGAIAVVPRLVAWDDYRDELTAKAEAMTGQTVAIQGRIDLNLLPQPTLSLGRTTLASRPDALDRVRLEVDRLDLEVKPLPLLGGRLDVEAVRLVRPVLQVEPAAAERPELAQLVGAAAWLPFAPDGPSRVSVVDGRAVLPELTFGRVSRFEEINLDLSASEPGGAVMLDGSFALNNQPLRVEARLGRLTEEASSTLRLALVADRAAGPGASTLTFGGVVWWRAAAPRLRGDLVFTGGDARSAIGRLGEALGHHIVPMPSWLAAPFRLTGSVGLEDERLEVADLAIGLNDSELTGSLSLTLATPPEIDLALDAVRLAVPAEISVIDPSGELAPLAALASNVRGQIDLSIGAIDYQGEAVRRLRAVLKLAGDGTAGIEEARAILPGQTDVSFTGQLAGIGGDPELRGKLAAVTENLRAALAWLGLSAADVPEGRLSSLSLASQVSIIGDVWRFGDIELRVDASRATGSVAINLAPRPRVAAALALDRFDVDAYWPAQALTDVLVRLARPLGAFDAAIEARLTRLTWGGVQVLDLGFAGRAVNGHLTISELSVGDLAETEARVAGEIDLANGAFDLSGELRGVQAARLLRRFGFEATPLLARLKPLSVGGLAKGSLEAAHVEAEISDGLGQVALTGEIALTGRQPNYDLDVAAEHPDYRDLLRGLGARPYADQGPGAPLTVAGKLAHDSGESLIAGTARLGETSFTGRVAWQDRQARPTMAARISVGEPTEPVLAGLLELSGLQLEWPALQGSLQGRWSERPLALYLLDRFDGELVLSSKGGLAGPGFELTARFEQGRLALDQVAMALWDGNLEGQLSLDVRRPLPYLMASIDLEAFDLAGLAAWLSVAPVVRGPADLHLEATGAGNTVRDLVGSLIGEVEIAVHDGAVLEALPRAWAGPAAPLTAIPDEPSAELASVTGSLPLQRGIVTLPPTALQVDGAGAQLEGQIDLYLWAADLTLRQDAGGPDLRVVGPLDRPQVRLIEAAEPGTTSP